MAETAETPQMLLVIKSNGGDFSFNRGKDEVFRIDPCPEGYTCVRDGISVLKKEPDSQGDGTIFTYKIETVPEYWRDNFETVHVSLPAEYLVEKWQVLGGQDRMESRIAIPVMVKELLSGGGVFFYGGMIGVNSGTPRAKKFVGISWEIQGDLGIGFNTPKSKFSRDSYNFILRIPQIPHEISDIKIGSPPNFDEVLKKKFNALKELLKKVGGDKNEFERGKAITEAEVEIWSQEYKKKKEEYKKLFKEAEAEKDRRIKEWKKSKGLMSIKNLASYIEAEVKRRYENE